MAATARHHELGLSVLLQRYVDLPWCSLAFGVQMEGTWYAQRYSQTLRMISARDTLGIGFPRCLPSKGSFCTESESASKAARWPTSFATLKVSLAKPQTP